MVFRTVCPRCLTRQSHTPHFEDFQLEQYPLNLDRRSLVANTLQDFAENDVGYGKALAVQLGVQPLRLRILGPLKIVHPDRGIHHNHTAYFAPRDKRETCRSPSQLTFPRKRRTLACPFV